MRERASQSPGKEDVTVIRMPVREMPSVEGVHTDLVVRGGEFSHDYFTQAMGLRYGSAKVTMLPPAGAPFLPPPQTIVTYSLPLIS